MAKKMLREIAMLTKRRFVLLAGLAGVFSLSANTVYVNCQFDSYAGHDGSTPEKALRTIQEGINKALASGDTVYVAPGVYNEGFGGAVKSWGPSRIGWNNRGINIIATGSNPADTVIVGERSSDTPEGYGEGGMRCIAVYNGAGSVIKGFTLRNGHSESTAVKDATSGRQNPCCFGGAVCVDSQDFTLADCVIEGCSAESYGAVYNGTYIRCRFTDCTQLVGGMLISGSTASSLVQLYCCVVDHNFNSMSYNVSNGIMIYNTKAVNCTIVDCSYGSCCYSANEKFYNCLFWNAGGRNSSCTYVNCITEADEKRPIMSTIYADTRLLPGSAAIGAGDALHLSEITISEEAAKLVGLKDYGGNDLPAEGALAAGANQTVGTPAAGGICTIGQTLRADGHKMKDSAWSYVFPDVYPTQYLFTVANTDPAKRICSLQFNGHYKDGYDFRFPDRNDRFWIMPPAKPDVVLTNNAITIGTIVYLKPEADASVADGSEEHPYRTFSAAIAAKGGGKVYVAKAGTYAEGVVTNATYGLVRMHLGNVLRITSEEGPEKTFIVGAKDTSPDADAYGRGPNAVRAISCDGNMPQVQGFTITGCYSDKGSSQKSRGAAAYGNAYTHIDDCIVTNNFGMEGVIYNGWAARSYIADNHTCDYVLSGTRCSGCVLERNEVEHPANGLIAGGSRFVHSLLIGNQGPDDKCYATSYTYRYGSVFLYGSTAAATGSGAGNIYAFMDSVAEGAGGIVADPLLADAAHGEFHPFVSSPVFGCGVRPTMDNYADDYWYYVSTDFEGNPIAFNDGVPVVGAFMKPTAKSIVAIDAKQGGVSVTESRVVLSDGGSVTVEAASARRPCTGVTVNGVTNDLPVTIAAADAVGGAVVSAVYTDVWYVDAANGNDANDGFTAATAKKTLAAALDPALVLAGDTVYAAEGLYNEGTMKADASEVIESRVVVTNDVKLIATGARDKTIIEGAATTTPDAWKYSATDDMRGMGIGAVRGVLLRRGATIRGFTVRNGFARAADTTGIAQWDNNGGGIAAYEDNLHGHGRNASFAEDCLVTNCAAFRGGGVFAVKCTRCVFVDNLAVYGGGATSDAYLYGCLSRDNKAHFPYNNVNRGHLWNYLVDGCTIMDGIITANAASNPKVLNTVISGASDLSAVPEGDVRSCVIVGKDGVTADSIGLDEKGAPIPGQSPAIDAANVALSTYEPNDRDAYGGQRIYNGAMDIGAVEGDWRPVYAKDIRRSQLAVEAASPNVIDHGDGIVTLNGASTLSAVWANPRHKPGDRMVTMKVTGNGTLTVKLNGEAVKEVTAATADPTFTFGNALASNTLDFEYVPGEGDTGHAEILNAKSLSGSLIFLR